MLVDFVADFIVRCTSCRKSTYAFIEPEEAEKAWNDGEADGCLNLIIDDLAASLSGEIEYILLCNNQSLWRVNEQSCDVDDILIKFAGRDHLISVDCEDSILAFEHITDYNRETYNIKVAPANGVFRFVRADFDGQREATALKFRFGDRYLFVTAVDNDYLAVCHSLYDIFEDDNTPMPFVDDSILPMKKI